MTEILRKHLSPKPLVITERIRFHKRDSRKAKQSRNTLHKIESCQNIVNSRGNFGDSLRHRLVCGLRNEQTQKQLLLERNMTFDSALDICVAVETATKDVVELEQYRDGAATNSNLGKTGDSTETHASDVHGMEILLMNTGSEIHSVTNVNRKDTPSQHASQMEDSMKNNVTREEIHRAATLVGNTHVPNVHQYTFSKIDIDENVVALEIHSMNRSPDKILFG